MTVLITGGCGFVGLNLAEALLASRVPVLLFDLREPPPAFVAAVGDAAANLRWLAGDVCERKDLQLAFDNGDITHVFHGAVITAGAERETKDPETIVEVNLQGTLNVLAASRQASGGRFVFPSSLTVYGESLFDRALVSEIGTPAVPESLYGITKYAAERAVLRLGERWGLDIVAGRIGSVFGPWEGDSGVRDLVSPLAQIAALAANGGAAVLPDMLLERDYIYSRDLARALVALLFTRRPNYRVYNLSVEEDWNDLCSRWCREVARCMPGFEWQVADRGETANIDYYDARPRARLDTTRMRTDLGIVPQFPPDLALADYAHWLVRTQRYFKTVGAG